jgi:hypothetical protein
LSNIQGSAPSYNLGVLNFSLEIKVESQSTLPSPSIVKRRPEYGETPRMKNNLKSRSIIILSEIRGSKGYSKHRTTDNDSREGQGASWAHNFHLNYKLVG